MKILNDYLRGKESLIHSLITIILAVLFFISCAELASSSLDGFIYRIKVTK